MNDVDLGSAIRSAGFDFARRLGSAEFRNLLKASGWTSEQHVIIALDEERVVDVISRMFKHETGSMAFVAMPHADEPHGFRILIVSVQLVEPRKFGRSKAKAKVKAIELTAGASIGMLYDALQPCGTYVPHAWSQQLLFQKVDA